MEKLGGCGTEENNTFTCTLPDGRKKKHICLSRGMCLFRRRKISLFFFSCRTSPKWIVYFFFYWNSLFIFPGSVFVFAACHVYVRCVYELERRAMHVSSISRWFERIRRDESRADSPDGSLRNDPRRVSRRLPFRAIPFAPSRVGREGGVELERTTGSSASFFAAARETGEKCGSAFASSLIERVRFESTRSRSSPLSRSRENDSAGKHSPPLNRLLNFLGRRVFEFLTSNE